MTGTFDQKGPTPPPGGYVVMRPRRTDAIGHALCHAFTNPIELPSEMKQSLDALDRPDIC